MADTLVIETADLRKSYGATDALRGLDVQVPAGSICGFLGKNGAGKTTTIKILLGMIRPTAGRAAVFGRRPDDTGGSLAIRQRTAFVSEDKDLIDTMTVGEIARFTASFYATWRQDLERRYLRAFELAPEQPVKSLSRGGRTKLALLLALCRGAELLILDEPTSGLDPAVTEQVLQAIVSHAADQSATVFFSSHQIAEVDQIADRVAIVDRGRTVVSGALDDLRENFRRVQLVFDGAAPEVALRAAGVRGITRQGRVMTVITSGGADPVLDETRGLNPVSVDVMRVSLKDIFLETVHSERVEE